jgi:hypothetical protein
MIRFRSSRLCARGRDPDPARAERGCGCRFPGWCVRTRIPTPGWGYPDPFGAPIPGTCTSGPFNSNRSEFAVEPGTENLVGTSKFFLDKYSTFCNFYLGLHDPERFSLRK